MKIKHIILLLLALGISAQCFGQRRISADVEVKNVTGNNVVTTIKSVYCTNNGRLVVCSKKPMEYVLETNINGESKYYFPRGNEVYIDNSGTTTSKDELLTIFLSGRLEDLGVGLYGYRLLSTEQVEDGMVKKTFKTTDPNMPPYCEIVYNSEYLPIYSATLTEDGHPMIKVYYSQYKTVGYVPFPHRSTQITYISQKDSTITRTIYSNIVVDGDDPMFDFKVPSDAKSVDAAPKQ